MVSCSHTYPPGTAHSCHSNRDPGVFSICHVLAHRAVFWFICLCKIGQPQVSQRHKNISSLASAGIADVDTEAAINMQQVPAWTTQGRLILWWVEFMTGECASLTCFWLSRREVLRMFSCWMINSEAHGGTSSLCEKFIPRRHDSMPRSFTITSNNCLKRGMKNSIQCNEREAI